MRKEDKDGQQNQDAKVAALGRGIEEKQPWESKNFLSRPESKSDSVSFTLVDERERVSLYHKQIDNLLIHVHNAKLTYIGSLTDLDSFKKYIIYRENLRVYILALAELMKNLGLIQAEIFSFTSADTSAEALALSQRITSLTEENKLVMGSLQRTRPQPQMGQAPTSSTGASRPAVSEADIKSLQGEIGPIIAKVTAAKEAFMQSKTESNKQAYCDQLFDAVKKLQSISHKTLSATQRSYLQGIIKQYKETHMTVLLETKDEAPPSILTVSDDRRMIALQDEIESCRRQFAAGVLGAKEKYIHVLQTTISQLSIFLDDLAKLTTNTIELTIFIVSFLEEVTKRLGTLSTPPVAPVASSQTVVPGSETKSSVGETDGEPPIEVQKVRENLAALSAAVEANKANFVHMVQTRGERAVITARDKYIAVLQKAVQNLSHIKKTLLESDFDPSVIELVNCALEKWRSDLRELSQSSVTLSASSQIVLARPTGVAASSASGSSSSTPSFLQ